MSRNNRPVLLIVLVCTLGVAACGSSASTGSAPNETTPSTDASGHVAIPVSANPSKSAKMICEAEVKGDLAELIGRDTTKPLTATWVDHVYACDYQYGKAKITLSVKELADRAATDAYFASLGSKLGKTQIIKGLGEGAFTTKDLSAVVRKDYKVLLVDTSGLPERFGTPPDSRANIALNVAATIMGCWTGA